MYLNVFLMYLIVYVVRFIVFVVCFNLLNFFNEFKFFNIFEFFYSIIKCISNVLIVYIYGAFMVCFNVFECVQVYLNVLKCI
jgi:hypothetical protein